MEKKFYRKLIRDKIPEKMTKLGVQFEIRTLGDVEYKKELLKKPGEECSALPSAAEKSREELIGELADAYDALAEVLRVFAISEDELLQARDKNAQTKGGFDKRIYLEWSENDGYQTNEKSGSDS